MNKNIIGLIKKIIGSVLIIVGTSLGTRVILGGQLLPHILGPITIITVGILLYVLKLKGENNSKNAKRVEMICIVITVVIAIAVIIQAFAPSMIQKIMDMHGIRN